MGPDLLGKSQVVIGCINNTGTDLPREAIGPRVQLLFGGSSYGPLSDRLMNSNIVVMTPTPRNFLDPPIGKKCYPFLPNQVAD